MAGAAPPRFSDIQASARAAAVSALPDLAGAARAAIAEADRFVLALAASNPAIAEKIGGLACARGCTACCHQMVGVTEAELDLLAQAVASLPSARRKAVVRRIHDIATRSAGLNVAGWWAARLPCPLLDGDGGCAVHSARPLPCRAMNSADSGVCRRAFAGQADARHIPVLAAQHGSYGHAQAGLSQALAAAALPSAAVALAGGLAARLHN